MHSTLEERLGTTIFHLADWRFRILDCRLRISEWIGEIEMRSIFEERMERIVCARIWRGRTGRNGGSEVCEIGAESMDSLFQETAHRQD